MWPPTEIAAVVPAELSTEIPREFECRFEIVGFPEPIRSQGRNYDALGAIMAAIGGIRALLAPYVAALAFVTLKGDHGIPASAMWFADPAENRYLEQLLDMEANHYMSIAKRPRRPGDQQ
jgi:hypothetical protein